MVTTSFLWQRHEDHKRIFEADQGPNTGGMGAYSPAPVVTADVFDRVMKEVMRPTVDGMKADGHATHRFLVCWFDDR